MKERKKFRKEGNRWNKEEILIKERNRWKKEKNLWRKDRKIWIRKVLEGVKKKKNWRLKKKGVGGNLLTQKKIKWKVLIGEKKIEEKKWNKKWKKKTKFERGKRKKFSILEGREKRNEIKNENKRKLDKIWERLKTLKTKKMTACGI